MPQTYDYLIAPKASFDATADAIRAMTGSQDSITWGQDGFADAIGSDKRFTLEEYGDNTSYISGDITYKGSYIRPYEFYGTAITSFSSDTLVQLGNAMPGSPANVATYNAFSICTSLTTFSVPNATSFYNADYTFKGCTSLVSVYAPKVKQVSGNMFNGCTAITALVFPGVNEYLYGSAMYGCTHLEAFEMGTSGTPGGTINQNVFYGCSALTALILRGSSVVSLGNINAFNNSPFASGKAGGTLYVPNSLKASYQSATNWSTILGYATNSIQSIEGSYYETHYADGTLIGG